MSWEDEITEEDIDIKYRDVAKAIGTRNFIELSKMLGGTNWSVPKLDILYKKIRDEKIIEDLEKYSARSVAKKYNLTERYVRLIAENKRITELEKSQVNIFEFLKMRK